MTNITNQNTETAKAPPVATVKSGLVNGSIWLRETEKGTFYVVSFQRRYRDAEGEWQSSASFNADDLPTLAKLAFDAHTKIAELKAEDKAAAAA